VLSDTKKDGMAHAVSLWFIILQHTLSFSFFGISHFIYLGPLQQKSNISVTKADLSWVWQWLGNTRVYLMPTSNSFYFTPLKRTRPKKHKRALRIQKSNIASVRTHTHGKDAPWSNTLFGYKLVMTANYSENSWGMWYIMQEGNVRIDQGNVGTYWCSCRNYWSMVCWP